jgi:hypothetical protein
MDRSEDNVKAKVRIHEAMDSFEFSDSNLYEIDHRLWIYQKDLATLRGAVHKMRSALLVNVGASLRGDSDQTRHAHTDNTLNHGRSHTRRLDFAESSEPNDAVSELMEASTSNSNEITAHVTEHRRCTASDTNTPGAGVGACGVADCVAHIPQLHSAVLIDPAKRAELAKGSSEKQRVELRRSPRRHRQT